MKINTKIRFSLRMIVLLAESKGVVNTTELGKKMCVSPKYLRKLAGPLEKSGIIQSVQGVYGGYILNREPNKITISTILDACGEKIDISDCISSKGCSLSVDCLINPFWEQIANILKKEFNRISIQDVIDRKFPREVIP